MTNKFRHRNRGTCYEVVAEAELQASNPVKEGDILVIYRDGNGKYWTRLKSEFYDGRFEPIEVVW